jgi:hypothetical protein
MSLSLRQIQNVCSAIAAIDGIRGTGYAATHPDVIAGMLRSWAEVSDDAQEDAWEEPILDWLQRNEKQSATTAELLSEALEIKKWTLADQIRVGSCMRRLGWRRKQVRVKRSREWRYFNTQLS